MNKTMKSWLLAVVLPLFLAACATPLVYSAREIRGQIVDAETRQPIEGAVVVAQWVLFEMGPGSGGHKGRLHIHETVTDKEGRYVIPAWGPRPHSPFTELHERSPEILIFKSGYKPKNLRNAAVKHDSVRTSDWDGKVVELEKFMGTLEQYADALNFQLSTSLPEFDYSWRSFPRMVLALYYEGKRLKGLGLKPGYRTTSFNIENFSAADRAYLQRYEK